jgi:hypothetical protein
VAQLGQPRARRRGFLDRPGRVHHRAREVRRDRGLEARVRADRHRERGQDHHAAERALHERAAGSPPGAGEQAAAAQRERQQRDRGPQCVRRPDQDGASAGRAHRDDRREDRPRARRVHEAERRADAEPRPQPVARGARAQPRQARQRRLEAGADRGHGDRDAEAEQHRDRDVAQRAIAQADAVDDLGHADDRDRERHRQAGDDAQRPAASARRARRQQRGQDRQHARAERGAGAGEHGE